MERKRNGHERVNTKLIYECGFKLNRHNGLLGMRVKLKARGFPNPDI